jgi:hypothetical protein
MMKGMDPKVQKKAAIAMLRALADDPEGVLADAKLISITIMKELPDELQPHEEEEEEEEEIKVKKKVVKKDDDPDTDDRPPWLKKKEIEVEEEEED